MLPVALPKQLEQPPALGGARAQRAKAGKVRSAGNELKMKGVAQQRDSIEHICM